jgi:hypothetical protein
MVQEEKAKPSNVHLVSALKLNAQFQLKQFVNVLQRNQSKKKFAQKFVVAMFAIKNADTMLMVADLVTVVAMVAQDTKLLL